jgi:hypothetical protein
MSRTNNTIMTFAKYAFANETEWATYKAQIINETGAYVGCAVVELGNICFATDEEGNCTDLSTQWAIDILWYGEPLDSFATKEVFPNPCGVHTFSGDDSLYLERFCSFNPESPYCVIPDPIVG